MNFVLNPQLKPLFYLIKIGSSILIALALGLEIANLYQKIIGNGPIQHLDLVFALERLALFAHGLEGLFAAFYLASREKAKALSYGAYTFFVGTIALIELFNPKEQAT
jgi:hypothetical protein